MKIFPSASLSTIHALLKDTISVSEPAFRNLHRNFKKSIKAGTPLNGAADILFKDLQKFGPDFEANKLSKDIKKISPVEIYKKRLDEKEVSRLILNSAWPPESENKISNAMPLLIRYKNYLTESEREEREHPCQLPFFSTSTLHDVKPYSEYGYICQILGIPFKEYFSTKSVQKHVFTINAVVTDRINILKKYLEKRIAKLFSIKLRGRKDVVKKWFVDNFGESSKRYLPEWKTITVNRRGGTPGYKRLFTLWKISLTVESKNDVGYTREKGTRYRADMIAGEIYFLKEIHDLFYADVERERLHFEKILDEVHKILDECSIHDIDTKIIPMLRRRYSTDTKINYLVVRDREHYLPFKRLSCSGK